MPCEQTTHDEQAKTKNFCPDCGASLVLEKLNKYKGIMEKNALCIFLVENQITLNEDVIYHNGTFHLASEFIKTNSFMQFPNNFMKIANHIYSIDEKLFADAKETASLGIPTDIAPMSRKFLYNLFTNINMSYSIKDRDKVLNTIIKNIGKLGTNYCMDQYMIYFLQDVKNTDSTVLQIIHETNRGSYEIIDVSKYHIKFVKFENTTVRAITIGNAEYYKVFRNGKDGYWNISSDEAEKVDSTAIRKWLASLPPTWKRDLELEEAFLKRYY